MKNSARGELVEPCELSVSVVKTNLEIAPRRRGGRRVNLFSVSLQGDWSPFERSVSLPEV